MRKGLRWWNGGTAAICAALMSVAAGVAHAAIDAQQLGARYDAAQSNLNFKVYSSRASRVEVFLYKNPTGSQEVARLTLSKDAASQVWSLSLPVSTIKTTYGITGAVYYG
ncbi:MAG: hypothetical protein ACREP7_03200, partial [Lysobacter sp.]